MGEELGCLLLSVLGLAALGGGIWALYALVRAHRFVGRAETLLKGLEARLAALEEGRATGHRPAGAAAWTARGETLEPGIGAGPAAPEAPASAPAGMAAPAAPSTAPPDRPAGPPAGGAVPGAAYPGAGSRAAAPADTAHPAGAAAGDAAGTGEATVAPGGSEPDATLGDDHAPVATSPGHPSPVAAPPGGGPSGGVAHGSARPAAPAPGAADTAAASPAPATTPAEPAAPWYHDLEERLGAKLPVWLGAIALALSGAFLVKYSVDQGWIGPPVRVGLGVGFGVVLLGASGLLRRVAKPIAGALAAAGIAVLYAAFLAAVHLYGLLAPAGGFALMALTTAVAVALSLVHGPIVAVVGLVGGLLTPYWIQTGDPDPKRLFAYLLLVHAGVLAVSSRRSWPGLSLASLAGGFLWVLAYLAGTFEPGDGVWLQLFLLLAVTSWGATALRRRPAAAGTDAEGGGGDGRPGGGLGAEGQVGVWASAVATLLAFGVVTAAESFGTLEWSLVGVLVAGLLVLARLRSEYHLAAWLGAATVAMLLLRWAVRLHQLETVEAVAEVDRFLVTGALLGLLAAGGAWLALWPAGGLPAPERRADWGVLAAMAGLAHPVLAWLGWRGTASAGQGPVEVFGLAGNGTWSLVALAVAALFAAAAVPVARRRSEAGMDGALAALAVAVTGLVAWAAALGFEREVLTLAWALEVAALAWLAGRFRLPVLVHLLAGLAAVVVVRLAFNPNLLEAAAGEPRIFNTLLWSYGLALVAFAAAVALLERLPGRAPGDSAGAAGEGPALPVARPVAAGLRWGMLVLLLALVATEVRHAFRPLEPLSGRGPRWERIEPFEIGVQVVACLLLGVLLLAASRRRPRLVGAAGRLGSRGVVCLGLLVAVAGPALLLNPCWEAWPVGATPLLNHLLWLYGGPALLLALAAAGLGRRPAAGAEPSPGAPAEDGAPAGPAPSGISAGDRFLGWVWGSGALLFLFLLVTFQVLQVFRGPYLTEAAASPGAEGWAISAAWLVLGVVLLGAGIAAGRRFLRGAALLVTAVAVVKVFLFDVARLGDLYRVLSFLGLGLSLLLLAWLYQRFVFRRGDP